MGTSRRLVISATGFPADNDTWRFMQSAYREPLGALATLAGDKVIIAGMAIVAGPGFSTVCQSGFVSYNGEILPFEQSTLPAASIPTVSLVEETVNLNYDSDIDNDGQQDNLPAYKTRFLRVGAGNGNGVVIGSFFFGNLTRLRTIKELSAFNLPTNIVQDAEYVHTDNNLTDLLLQKLEGIAAGAEVNVQADWQVSNQNSDAYIRNKPTNLLTFYRKGNVYLGDLSQSNSVFNCTFPDVGTTSYQVVGSMEVVNGGAINVFWAVGTKATNYFTIYTGETFGIGQSLRFRYTLTPMY